MQILPRRRRAPSREAMQRGPATRSSRSTPTGTPSGSPHRAAAGELDRMRRYGQDDAEQAATSNGNDGLSKARSAPRSPVRDVPVRPPIRGTSYAADSYYMASASGSQTDAADAGGESSSSSESETEAARAFGDRLSPDSLALLSRRYASAVSGLDARLQGEGRKGDHILLKKRSSSPRTLRGNQANHGTGATTTRERSWGSALLETLEGNSHSSSRERRRPASPTVAGAKPPRNAGRARPGRVSPDEEKREPSPPLTMDSIRPGWSPFPHFHIRRSLIFEVVILVVPLGSALLRIASMQPSDIFPSIPAMPMYTLGIYTLAIPFIALFRREGHYFKAPFTDERGYRNAALADDGIAVALTLPILLATATWWDTYRTADATGAGVGLRGIRSLVDVWEANGVRASLSPRLPPDFDLSALSQPIERARSLFRARYELVLLTLLNAATLLLHLVLARTLFRIERLPQSNTKRFFGFMALTLTVSTAVWAGLHIVDRSYGQSFG